MKYAMALCVLLSPAVTRAGPGGQFSASAETLISLGGEYVRYNGVALELGYHFSDLFGVELTGAMMFADYSDLVHEVYDYEMLTPEVVDLKQMDFAGFGSVVVTPLFGLANVYGTQLDYHFYVTAGIGVVSTLETCAFDRGDCSGDVGIGRGMHRPAEASDAYKLAGSMSAGFRLAFVGLLGAHLGLRNVFYSDRAVGTDGVTTTGTVHLGLLDVGVNVLF